MRCRVGDLAIIIKPHLEENLGALVEVVSLWVEEDGCWLVRSLSGPRPRCDGEHSEEGTIEDVRLWPIRHTPPESGPYHSISFVDHLIAMS